MKLTEDNIKAKMKRWLKAKGYKNVNAQLGRRKGFDVAGVNPKSHKRIVIECKGAEPNGGKVFSWDTSWRQVSGALFNAIKLTANPKTRMKWQ
jgi:hypothetical protein